jgi:DNA-binding response OmpR family regulator
LIKKVFIIEDEKDIRDLLQHYLKKEGYEVQSAPDGPRGMQRLKQERFDILLLDLMLPGMDGLEVCRTLRSDPQNADLPIIMITAKGEETDRIVGLELGADDYIAKPFSPREVVARVKAVLRRWEKPRGRQAQLRYGEILLDPERHEVSYQGKMQKMTSKEFGLLEFFLQNQGRVLSRENLLNQVWGYDYFGTTRTVDVHVARLRHKFPAFNERLISVKGLGYKLVEEQGT